MESIKDALTQLADDRHRRTELARTWGIHRFEFLSSTSTTQEVARRLAEWENDDWILVVTDFQSAGRGQHGRKWHATPGSSLMFSLAVRPQDAAAMALIPIRVGIALARAIEPRGGVEPRIRLKWPNDLMIGEQKAGGILSEGSIRGEETLAVIGVGINIRPFSVPVEELRNGPAFLADHFGAEVDRLELLGAIIPAVREALQLEGSTLSERELEEYARRDWLQGRTTLEPMPGRACGINRYGHLLIERNMSTIEPVMAGRVMLA